MTDSIFNFKRKNTMSTSAPSGIRTRSSPKHYVDLRSEVDTKKHHVNTCMTYVETVPLIDVSGLRSPGQEKRSHRTKVHFADKVRKNALLLVTLIVLVLGLTSLLEEAKLLEMGSSRNGQYSSWSPIFDRLYRGQMKPFVVYIGEKENFNMKRRVIDTFDDRDIEDHLERQSGTDNDYETIMNKTEHVGGHCVPAAKWQTESYPTCNLFHEIYFPIYNEVTYLGRGHHRDIWQVGTFNVVAKTLRLYRDFEARNYEMHRIDALVTERLTKSSFVVDIYGFCGQSVLNEMGVGDITSRSIERKMYKSSKTKLRMAYNLAAGINDMHSLDENRGATVIHRDIGASNVLITFDGKMKLNDFNSANLVFWDEDNGKMCHLKDKFLCGQDSRRSDTRTPEECKGELLDEKVDVYSIACVIFRLISGVRMYHYDKKQASIATDNDKMRTLIAKGGYEPKLPRNIEASVDPAIVALRTAMNQALTYEATKRPSAEKIAFYLDGALKKMKKR